MDDRPAPADYRFEGVFTNCRTGERWFYDVPYRAGEDAVLTPVYADAIIPPSVPAILTRDPQSMRARVRLADAEPSAKTTNESRWDSDNSVHNA